MICDFWVFLKVCRHDSTKGRSSQQKKFNAGSGAYMACLNALGFGGSFLKQTLLCSAVQRQPKARPVFVCLPKYGVIAPWTASKP